MDGQFVVIFSRGEFYKMPVEKIIYIERVVRKTRFNLTNMSRECYERIEDVIDRLDDRFHVCHKSLIINFDHISHTSKNTIWFVNDDYVTMSATNWRLAKKAYKQYLEKKYILNRKKG